MNAAFAAGDRANAANAASAASDADPLENLWQRLAPPVDVWAASEALLGMSRGAAQLLAGILLLTSSEAEALFAGMPSLLRSLSVSMVGRSARVSGEVRGPILWSETIAARASGGGDPHAYVYTLADRAYDTAENRLLVSALRTLVHAGESVNTRALGERDSDLARLVRDRVALAHRWLEHRSFTGVAPRVTRRDRQRTRASRKRRQYQPTLDMLDRQAVPLTPADLALVVDPATSAQLVAVSALVEATVARGIDVPALLVHRGAVEGGPIRFIHPRSRRARAEGQSGVFLAGRAVDVAVDIDGQVIEVPTLPAGNGHLLFEGPASLDAVLAGAGL